MEKPYDLGSEGMLASDMEVGKSYYFRAFGMPCTKARVVSVHPIGYAAELHVW